MNHDTAMNHITDLCAFLNASPVNFWAVETVRQRLEEQGFSRLDMGQAWDIEPGSRHYVVQNGSAIFAFAIFFRHFLSRESNDLSVTFDWFTASSSTKASSNLFKSFTGFFGK